MTPLRIHTVRYAGARPQAPLTGAAAPPGWPDSARVLTAEDLPIVPFAARDLPEAVTRKAVERALDHGVVRRVLRGVYVRADLPDTVELRARAAGLVMSPHAVLVDRSAAWLHGVDVLAWHEQERLPPLESFVLRGHGRPQRAGVFGGVRDLSPDDIVRVGGVAATGPTRTALDLACCLPPRDALAALDQFLHQRLVEKVDLRRLLPRFVRRRGVVQARWLVDLADAAAESQPESWSRFEIVRNGLPAPTLQHWVEIAGVTAYRLDLAYPLHRVAIEYDGAAYHSSPADRARDERRRTRLRELGWIVIVLTREDFVGEGVERWIGELRAALASRRSATARVEARNWRLTEQC